MSQTDYELRTLITGSGQLRLSFQEQHLPAPGDGEVVVAMRAAPINPSDLGLLVGAADLGTARTEGDGWTRTLTAEVPPGLLPYMAGRLGQSFPAGNEGAGTVVAAGPGRDAQALMGQTVALRTGTTYARKCLARVRDVLPLPPGTDAADGAAAFVNPLTALGMVHTMRAEGHTALVHTAAASNLGRMLVRLCREEGVALVNVVRRPEQAAALRTEEGAEHVCDSSAPDFRDRLVDALRASGATLAFDAVGGGPLADTLLAAMETVASTGQPYSRYGSSGRKQVYIYGMLDTGPTILSRSYGLSWGLSGWLVTHCLERAGPEVAAAFAERVRAGLRTTFASHYTRTVSLPELLDADVLRGTARKATGEKVLVDPSRDG